MAIPKFVEVRGDDWIATVKDAKRYRWLKENHLQTGTDSWIRTGDDLEEAIDAAMAATDDSNVVQPKEPK